MSAILYNVISKIHSFLKPSQAAGTMISCHTLTQGALNYVIAIIFSKNRFLDHIGGVLVMPHIFPTGQERQVAVLTDCLETQSRVQEMGAHMVGGKEVVKLVLVSYKICIYWGGHTSTVV